MTVDAVVAVEGHLPHYARSGDAGADLRCATDVCLEPGERMLVGTGVSVALPPNTVGLVTPRSGLAARLGLGIVNAPGIIDSGYRGEIRVCLINHDTTSRITLAAGDRVAQLVVLPYITAHFRAVEALDETERGYGGYGSTGVGNSPPQTD